MNDRTKELSRRDAASRMRLAVIPDKCSRWRIVSIGSQRLQGIYKTKREAEQAARSMIRSEGGEVIVKNRDGKIRSVDTYRLNRSGVAKVSAVEGLSLSEEMASDIETLDRQGLSDKKRRSWLLSKYGQV